MPHDHPRTADDPRCGRCGYIVRGIMSLTCPECGSDLREVGIRVGRNRAGGTATVATLAIIWALLLWIAGAAIMTAIEHLPPHWQQMNLSAHFQQPASKAYRGILVQAMGNFRSDVPQPIPILPQQTLVLTANDGAQSRLVLDFQAQTWSVDGRPPAPAGGLISGQTIANWMKQIGIDATSQSVQAEIASVMAFMQMPPRSTGVHGSWSTSSGGSRSGVGFGSFNQNASGRSIPRIWPLPVLALLGLVLWLLGVRWMAQRFNPR